jgi:hypothetical protein
MCKILEFELFLQTSINNEFALRKKILRSFGKSEWNGVKLTIGYNNESTVEVLHKK